MTDLPHLNNRTRRMLAVLAVLILSALACRVGPQGGSAPAAPTAAAPVPAAPTAGSPSPEAPTQADPTLAVPTLAADPGEAVDRTYCESSQVHPIGVSIAETYDMAYEDVIDLYCDGHTFDEVLLALETGAQTGAAAAVILALRDAGLSWDQIWRELNLVE